MKNYLILAVAVLALSACNSSGNSDDGDGSKQGASLDGSLPGGGGGNAVTDAIDTVLDLVNDLLGTLDIDASALTGSVSDLAAALADVDPDDPAAVAAVVADFATGDTATELADALNGATGGLGSLGMGKTTVSSLVNAMDAAAMGISLPASRSSAIQSIAKPLSESDSGYVSAAAALLANSGGYSDTAIAALNQLAEELAIVADSDTSADREAALADALSVLLAGLSSQVAGDDDAAATALADFSVMLTGLLQDYEFTVLNTIALLQLQQAI